MASTGQGQSKVDVILTLEHIAGEQEIATIEAGEMFGFVDGLLT